MRQSLASNIEIVSMVPMSPVLLVITLKSLGGILIIVYEFFELLQERYRFWDHHYLSEGHAGERGLHSKECGTDRKGGVGILYFYVERVIGEI